MALDVVSPHSQKLLREGVQEAKTLQRAIIKCGAGNAGLGAQPLPSQGARPSSAWGLGAGQRPTFSFSSSSSSPCPTLAGTAAS